MKDKLNVTGKAKVKEDTTWRYKGLILNIIGIYTTHNHGYVYPVGTRELKLSLEGTKWFDEQKYTIIPETDLELLEINIEENIEDKIQSETLEVHKTTGYTPSDLLQQNRELIEMLEVARSEFQHIKDKYKLVGDGERFLYQSNKLLTKHSKDV